MNHLNEEERKCAINWLCNCNFDVSTVAQHFNLNSEQLKNEIRS